MRRFVNGVETDLEPTGAEIIGLPDRLMVRTEDGARSAVAFRQGDTVYISYRGQTYTIEKATRARVGRGSADGDLRAPMPGLIVDVIAAEGDPVSKGDKILVLEAMKTQQAFLAPFDGVVVSIGVSKGQQVGEGQQLAVVTPRGEG